MNVYCRGEPVATDTIYSETPCNDDGSTCVNLFVSTKSLVSDIYGMKTDKQFVNTLEDNIRARGATSKLISDSDQSEVRNSAQIILWAIFIDDWQSEPNYQHHNFYEHCYQTIKLITNTILVRAGAPVYTWFLALIYLWFLLKHTHADGINSVTIIKATGSTSDISPL